MTRVMIAAGYLAACCAPALSGCAALTTNPGHPNSYKTAYYDCSKEWSQPRSCDAPVSAAATMTTASPASATVVFTTARTPSEIWKARAYTWKLHLRYEAAAYKAQDVQGELAVPLFGAAVATAATALAKANTLTVALVGLGGGAAGAGYAYLHPDKDAATDQTADAQALCVLDQSKILGDMSAVPLTLDRAALRDAVNALERDAGSVLNGSGSANQAEKTAIQDVVSSADTSRKALDGAIAGYVMLPGEIYSAADSIDMVAKTSGARTLDFASLLKSIQNSATNQATTAQASSDVQAAALKAAQAIPGAAAAVPVVAPAPKPTPALAAATKQAASGADAGAADLTAAANAGPPPAGDRGTTPATGTNTDQVTALQNAVTGNGTATVANDVNAVTAVAKMSLDDIPSPNFSDIAANIKTCTAGK